MSRLSPLSFAEQARCRGMHVRAACRHSNAPCWQRSTQCQDHRDLVPMHDVGAVLVSGRRRSIVPGSELERG